MTILIPSKNIYGRIKNEKVRNNLIQRIEVNAFETVPSNEYNVPVVNVSVEKTTIEENKIFQSQYDKDLKTVTQRVNQNSAGISASYVKFGEKWNYYFDIKIPIVSNNKYISSLFLGKDKENNPNIKYTLYGIKKIGVAKSNFSLTPNPAGYNIIESAIIYQEITDTSEEEIIEFPKSLSHTYDKTIGYTVTAKTNLTDTSTIADITQATLTEDKKYFQIKGQIMCSLRSIYLEGWTTWNSYSGLPEPTSLAMSGEYTLYEPTQIQITINGNLIGIDLKEKTLYLPNDDQTSKKVFSVNGNELIQTTNKDENSLNAIQKLYLTTYNQYLDGKETAQLRCSISDYYTENEDLAISIKKQNKILENHNIQIFEKLDGRFYYFYAWSPTIVEEDTYVEFSYTANNIEYKKEIFIHKGEQFSTDLQSGQYPATNISIISVYEKRNMNFVVGDKVIPMVYDIQTKSDRAMSYYKNGYAKIFEVVGTKYSNSGAVFQILDLIEVTYSQLDTSTLNSLANFKLKELYNKKLQSV